MVAQKTIATSEKDMSKRKEKVREQKKQVACDEAKEEEYRSQIAQLNERIILLQQVCSLAI